MRPRAHMGRHHTTILRSASAHSPLLDCGIGQMQQPSSKSTVRTERLISIDHTHRFQIPCVAVTSSNVGVFDSFSCESGDVLTKKGMNSRCDDTRVPTLCAISRKKILCVRRVKA